MKAKIILWTVIVGFSAPAWGYNLEDYYPLNQGNNWTYVITSENKVTEEETYRIEGKEEVEAIETVKMFSSADENEYKCLAKDEQGLRQYKYFDEDEYELFNPALVVFPNLQIGESKEYSADSVAYTISGLKQGKSSLSRNITIETQEGIEVPAGSFSNCLRVSVVTTKEAEEGSFSEEKSTVWFAQGVGKVKEIRKEIGYNAQEGRTFTYADEFALKRAIVNGIEYGKAMLE